VTQLPTVPPRRATPPTSFRRCGPRQQPCLSQKGYCCLAACNNLNNNSNVGGSGANNCRTTLIRTCSGRKNCANLRPQSKYYCCSSYHNDYNSIPIMPVNGFMPTATSTTATTTPPPVSIFPDITISASNTSPVVNNNDFTNISASRYQCSAITAPLSQYMYDSILFESKEHGCFRKSVPTMPLIISIFLCILNFFLPGSGTLLASITILFGCSTEYGKEHWKKAFVISLLAAILQIVSAIFVVGWVWSVMWGINFIKNSTKAKNPKHMFNSMNI
ncbi:hypothetical protein B4U79_05168, partial [Dinothrombium tinctorium]